MQADGRRLILRRWQRRRFVPQPAFQGDKNYSKMVDNE